MLNLHFSLILTDDQIEIMHKIKYLAILLTLPLFGQAQKKIEFTEYDLDNGMHVILHKDNSTPIVAVSIMYHVGSKNENPNRTGFAHFFEHLLFEGSANIERGEYDSYVENAGGTLNANTSNDRTYYFEILPSNQLELGMWLESERLLHARVEEVGIETQREVVKEEKRQRMDNQPYGSALANIMKRAYREHPYRWTTIGSMDHLNAAEEIDYVNFYRTYYVPNNATLSIAGDIDIEQTKKLIDKYFAGIPSGEKLNVYRDLVGMGIDEFLKERAPEANHEEMKTAYDSMKPLAFIDKYFPKVSSNPIEVPRPAVKEPPLGGEVRDTIYDNIQLPGIFEAYRIPAQGTEDYYAVQLLSSILSRGNSSRLQKSVVDEQMKAMTAFLFPFPLEDPGVAMMFAIANADVDPMELEKAIDAEIKKLQEELISEEEHQKLNNQVENQFLTSNSTMAGIAESLANYHVYFGDADLINTEIERYKKVTREDIREAAKKYLVPENRVILYYLPKEEE